MNEHGTVLVVDDDAGMRLTLNRILTHQGYRVVVASDGTEAIEAARREPLDFALIDYRMTGLNGGEVCASVSGLQPHAAVYLMTAHVSPEAAEAAWSHGTAGIFYKPLDLPQVLAAFESRRPGRIATPAVAGGTS